MKKLTVYHDAQRIAAIHKAHGETAAERIFASTCRIRNLTGWETQVLANKALQIVRDSPTDTNGERYANL